MGIVWVINTSVKKISTGKHDEANGQTNRLASRYF